MVTPTARADETARVKTKVDNERRSIQIEVNALSPRLAPLQLLEINKIATRYHKEGDNVRAVAAYNVLFEKARRNNLTHPELCVCHGNCASACLRLGLYEEALHHADESVRHSSNALHRSASISTYAKSFRRRGEALMGLRRWREAADAFAKGMDVGGAGTDACINTLHELKMLWKEAERKLETEAETDNSLLLTWRTDADPTHARSIAYHPHAAPIHRIKGDQELPLTLLTPFQAENDPHIKETYNYMTVQGDIRMPKRALRDVRDVETFQAYRNAIEQAINSLEASDTDARVLNLSCGPGVSAVHAIRAGARHVTAADRWLYLSLAAKETMLENEMDEERYDVVYKRPTELRLRDDVPVSCNVLVIGTAGVELESGVLLATKHCFEEGLVMNDCAVLPGSIRIMCRLVLKGKTRRRHEVIAVSETREAWYFDLKNAYERSETKEVVFSEISGTRADSVEYWYELDLSGHKLRRPSTFQRLAGELLLTGDAQAGTKEVVVMASHNTVGLRFDVSSSNYLRLFRCDDVVVDRPCFDVPLEPYTRAIEKDAVLDGSGVVLVPQASDMQEVIEVLEGRDIEVITTDLKKGTDPVQLQRGRNGVPVTGVDAVVLYDRKGRYSMVEEWRTALGFSKVVPSCVTWWCMGAEAVTRPVEGVKLACLDRYRESGWVDCIDGDMGGIRTLTDKVGVKNTLMKLKVNSSGYMNAVIYWHDLDGVDGFDFNARIVYLERAVRVDAGSKVSVIGGGPESARTFKLRGNVGTPRALPPWEVTWGGGASVENPHYQRVHYCELILREFLGVVERGKTDIWKDVKLVLRHCGSLFLDRRTVVEVGRRLRSMEKGLLLAGRGIKFSRWVDVFDETVWFD